MLYGKPLGAGSFVVYRLKTATDSHLIPARLQSPMQRVVALADVTGIGTQNGKPRIACGAVKWHDVSRLKIYAVTEDELIAAPTVKGVVP